MKRSVETFYKCKDVLGRVYHAAGHRGRGSRRSAAGLGPKSHHRQIEENDSDEGRVTVWKGPDSSLNLPIGELPSEK